MMLVNDYYKIDDDNMRPGNNDPDKRFNDSTVYHDVNGNDGNDDDVIDGNLANGGIDGNAADDDVDEGDGDDKFDWSE